MTAPSLSKPVHDIYPSSLVESSSGEACMAAFFRGEPFVDIETLSRVSRFNFVAGDKVRIRYLRMPDVPVLTALGKEKLKVDLIFSITFTIPEEE